MIQTLNVDPSLDHILLTISDIIVPPRITKKVAGIITSLNEDDTLSSLSSNNEPPSLPEVMSSEVYNMPPRTQASDFKWLLSWNGFTTTDNNKFVRYRADKTEAWAVDFISSDTLKYAYVNKNTGVTLVNTYNIQDAFMLLLYK